MRILPQKVLPMRITTLAPDGRVTEAHAQLYRANELQLETNKAHGPSYVAALSAPPLSPLYLQEATMDWNDAGTLTARS